MRLVTLLLFSQLGVASAQSGCPDPQALNYDPVAVSNDGSCTYPATNYAPTTKTPLSGTVKETSGLILAGGRLWTHNDGGNDPNLYQIDSLSNAIHQTVTIGGTTNVDWEDLTFDGTFFYIADVGNNANGNRTDLKIYKFPMVAIPTGSNVTVPANAVETIAFAYEDQTDFMPQGTNNTRFDCEAMIWRNDSLHLFTKDWIGQQTVHYVLPAAAGTHLARKRETLPAGGLITGAAVSIPGVVLLLGYRTDNGVLFAWLLFDHTNSLFFNGNKRYIGLGLAPLLGQVEGICFRDNRGGYISNEELTVTIFGTSITIPPRLYGFEVAQWLPSVFLPAEEPTPDQKLPCHVSPNPIQAGMPIRFAREIESGANISIWDTAGRFYTTSKSEGVAPTLPGMYFLHVRSAINALLCTDKIIIH
ncbi:MAG: T9SS C-terminal target domain-containing protein [Saprospiraceae bacterium]